MARDLPAVFHGENGEKPSTPARDARGRFVAGGSAGPGRPANPFARYQRELRLALAAEVKPADLQAVLRKMLQLARRGSLPAAEWVFRWSLGGPAPLVDPDKIEAHELEVRRSRPRRVDWLLLTDEQADREPAEEAAEEGADASEEEPEDPRAPTSPPLRQTLAWAVEELAQSQYALRAQRPPLPDPLAGWARFAAQRVEFDEAAAVATEQLLLSYLRWCAGHGQVPLEEDKALAWLQGHGATVRTAPLSQCTMLVGVRVTA